MTIIHIMTRKSDHTLQSQDIRKLPQQMTITILNHTCIVHRIHDCAHNINRPIISVINANGK